MTEEERLGDAICGLLPDEEVNSVKEVRDVRGDVSEENTLSGGKEIVGYSAVVTGNTAPLFCPGCASDVNREIEPIISGKRLLFVSMTCTLCGETFHDGDNQYNRGTNK